MWGTRLMKDIDDLDYEARRSRARIEGRAFEIIPLQEVIRGRGMPSSTLRNLK